MNIRLYKDFTKRKNSTKTPPSNMTYIERGVVTKENTSIENPVFIVTGFDPTINYVHVPLWNRYYFIDDVVMGVNGVSELHCSCDVLASYKAQIGAYTCFVERCSNNAGIDTHVQDNALTCKENISEVVSASTGLWSTGGVVICRTINMSNGITTYIGSMSNFADLFNPDIDPQSITDFIQGLLEYFLCSPADYVLDTYFLPIGLGEFTPHATTDIVASGWYSGGGAYRWNSNVPIIHNTVTLSKPSAKYTDWRESNPAFSKYSIYIPAVGEVDIASDLISKTLQIEYYIDINTGEVAYFLIADGDVVATYNGNLKSGLQTGSMFPSGSAVMSGAGAVAGVISGNPIAIGSSLISATQNIISPSPSINGSMGSCAGVIGHNQVIITRMSKDSCDFPNTLGKPCCKNVQLSNIAGYIKTAGASLDVNGFGGEKGEINSYLDGGFYYE